MQNGLQAATLFFGGWCYFVREKVLSDDAYTLLKESIATTGHGVYISARQFADDIGMSYTPVREAFLRLQKEGFLKQVPNVGFFVQSLDLQDIIQIFQVRECLEVFVLENVFDSLGDEQFSKIEDCIAEQEAAIERRDMKGNMLKDIELHEIPFALYNNPFLYELYHNVRERYLLCSSKLVQHGSSEAILEHRNLLESMKKGDKDGAVELLLEHLANAKARIRDGYIHYIK